MQMSWLCTSCVCMHVIGADNKEHATCTYLSNTTECLYTTFSFQVVRVSMAIVANQKCLQGA